MRYLDQLKKFFILMVAALSVSIVHLGPASAQSPVENYLWQIAQYTYGTLQILQNPANFAGFAVSFLQHDDAEDSINTTAQHSLAKSGWSFTISQNMIKTLQKQIMSDILNVPLDAFSGKNPSILTNIPEVNEISFSSLIGVPPVESKPVDFYGYVKNAAAFNTYRPLPSKSWEGDDDAKQKYRDYFYTVTAVESFDAYIISQLATDNMLKVNETRNELIDMASKSSYIAAIATQKLGPVLRQILLFSSQLFVINSEIQKSLRDLVVAQALTNTMLIKLNEANEMNLLRAAKGKNDSSF